MGSEIADGLHFRAEDGLAIITIDKPATLNALNRDMVDDLQRLATRIERDPAIFALVITGTGRAFCSGLDVTLLANAAESGGAAARMPTGDTPALFGYLRSISKPVIAALNGVAAVGGFVLAMMCDLRFAGESASLTMAMSNRGLIAEHGTSWFLPRQIGISRSLDLMWSSRRVKADEALQLGLVDRVVPDAELLQAVKDYVADLRARVSPRAVAQMKAQVYGHLDMSFPEAVRDSQTRMLEALKHPDIREGARAFIERRPPQFAPWTGE
ncbi:MAG: enoyl-CoA hydratase-related protein [Hyphomonadaceae bacterium]|nr:enoyl-CoA hydratase-related protein [Hyphomonadaceae bacterium]